MSQVRFVDSIPDLIQPEDYAADPEGRLVRVELRLTPEGLEILADAQRPALLEELLEALEGVEVEQMLCG